MPLLNQLPVGESASVIAIHAEQALHQRLSALGFRLGKSLTIIRQASFGGPIQVRIGSTDVIIRLKDATCIELSSPSTSSCP